MMLGLAQLFPVSHWPPQPDWEHLEGRACATPDSEPHGPWPWGGGRMRSAKRPARRRRGDCRAPVQLRSRGSCWRPHGTRKSREDEVITRCHPIPCCRRALPSALGLPLSPHSVTGAGATLVLGEDRAQAAAGPCGTSKFQRKQGNTQRRAASLLGTGREPARGTSKERRGVVFIVRHDNKQGTRVRGALPARQARGWASSRMFLTAACQYGPYFRDEESGSLVLETHTERPVAEPGHELGWSEAASPVRAIVPHT